MTDNKLSPGSILRRRYRIKSEIGEGAYGCVYLAEDLEDEHAPRAIKELREESIAPAERHEVVELFKREAQVLRMMDHPSIPHVADLFAEGTHHYLVMDYIQGETLQAIMEKKAPDLGRVLSWSIKICGILEYLHSLNVIFRDIKPSNIMVTRDGRLYLVDYGTARFYSSEQAVDTHLLGTPGFAPPEQYGRGQSDQRSDIYALGATMYYLLTGADIATFNFAFPPIRTLKPHIPERLERVLGKCLETTPAGRYQKVQELKDELELCLHSPKSTASAVSQPGKLPPSKQPSPPQPAGPQFNPLVVFLKSPGTWTTAFFVALYLLAMCVLTLFYDGTSLTSMSAFYAWFPLVNSLICLYGFFVFALIISIFVAGNTSYVKVLPDKLGCFYIMAPWIFGIVMVGVCYPNLDDFKTMKCEHNLMCIGKALDSYKARKGTYPSTSSELERVALKKEMPRCPAAKDRGYIYWVNEHQDRYTIFCNGACHGGDPRWTRSPAYTAGKGFPQYSSAFGLLHDEKALRDKEK